MQYEFDILYLVSFVQNFKRLVDHKTSDRSQNKICEVEYNKKMSLLISETEPVPRPMLIMDEGWGEVATLWNR